MWGMTVPSRPRRPRDPKGRTRASKLQVRLTRVEEEIVRRAAEEQGLALAAMLREAALAFIVSERLRDGTSALDRRLARPDPSV